MGIFKIRKKNTEVSTNADFYDIDMHSHLIPGIDDGVRNTEESLEIISSLKSMGIKKIIITPHISLNYPNNPEKIHTAFEQLKNNVAEKNIDIELAVAAEYMIDDGFSDIFKSGKLMTFGDNFVLIELTTFSPYPGLSDLLFEMQIKGYNVILAHPERYLYWQNDFEIFRKLKDRELYFQLNILSLTKIYSAEIHKMAVKLIKERMIDFIGSDIHSAEYIPKIKNTIADKLFQELADTGQIKNNKLLN
jgi:protein-tyrosine phosphatase